MATSVAVRPPVRAALEALIDYAGLFPPAALSLRDAWDEYTRAQAGPFAWMLGRFIVASSQLDDSLETGSGPLSVIVETGSDPDAWTTTFPATLERIAGLRAGGRPIQALEVPLRHLSQPEDLTSAATVLATGLNAFSLRDVPTYAELPAVNDADALREIMEAFAQHGFGAKVRCGGLTAAAFPSVEQLARFVSAAVAARVAFKATAGLHHPIRHLDAVTGSTMHGFLNLLAAAAFADRADARTLDAIVAEEDASAFAFDDGVFRWKNLSVDVDGLKDVRARRFVGYGSCSFDEPVDDLIALGMLTAG